MGTFLAAPSSFASTRASSPSPRSVRSPQSAITSAAAAMAPKRGCSIPWDVRLQCRSPTAATRTLLSLRLGAIASVWFLDSSGPALHVLTCHLPSGGEPPVREAPLAHVGEVLFP